MNGRILPSHRFVLAAVIVAVGAVAAAYLAIGILGALLIAAVVCIVFFLLRPILMPKHHGITKVRVISLLCFFGLIGSFNLWAELINSAIKAIASDPSIRTHAPWLEKISIDQEPAYLIVAAGLIAVVAVNYFVRDRSIPGRHPKQIDDDFPEPRFDEKLAAFCSALEQHLIQTDRQANWSPEFYTELEAEVEVQSAIGSSQRKRVTNLQRAIRSDRETRAFLVLGDPGSGKSVALRKLARDMLKQVGATGRIPIYINLREWTHSKAAGGQAWTEANPPTFDDLEKFVIDRLSNIGDAFTEQFVNQYFHKLWQAGRLFFLFDSFDEIPDLLDSNEESWLIDSLSTIFNRFITSGPHSRGILASRMFRRPTSAYVAGKILEIRPLTEESIIAALSRHPQFTEAIKIQLFRDRQDLIPIARNPLLASLLGEWVQANHNLPRNQADLYRNYLVNQLKKCQDRIDKNGLTIDEILDVAQEVAWFVFESPTYGLEAPVQVLSRQMSSPHTDAVIGILSHARIARVTNTEPKSFAFSHRRFLEYFVSTKLLAMPERLPTEHIPTDSRGRDALILYAQICEDEKASDLAELCWKEINTKFDSRAHQLRCIHSLRFLVDAFRSRPNAVESFSSSLNSFITNRLSSDSNLIHTKISLEATGLLEAEHSIPILNQAISSKNTWLQETAFRACRQIPEPSTELLRNVSFYIITMPDIRLWRNRSHIEFALSLSAGFKEVKKVAVFRSNNFICSTVAICSMFLLAPSAFLLLFFAFPFFLAFFRIQNSTVRIYFEAASAGKFKAFFNNRISMQTLKMILTESSFSQSEKTTEEFMVQAARNFFGVVFSVVSIAAIFLHYINPFLLSPTQEEGGFYIFEAFLTFLLGALALDYQKIRFSLATIKISVLIKTFFFLLLIALPSFAFSFLIEYYISNFAKSKINFVFFIFSTSIFFASLVFYTANEIKERQEFKRFLISKNMNRADIALALKKIKNYKRRISYVRKLDSMGAIASGEWPRDFSLSVSSDPAITELAKLEERWLGLDR